MTLRIGLAGIHGHGRGHVEAARALEATGDVRIAAVADPRGGGDAAPGVAVYADAQDMIAREQLDVVVLCTPIPTHARLAAAALAHGAHVLLEKPPVVSVAEHEILMDLAHRAGRGVQVGFQSLASAGVRAAADVVASGLLGDILHTGAVGVWSRSEEYWRRAPWAGHRRRGGRVVADGAATNPLAHALATALAVAGATAVEDVTAVETDMRRANEIATDDTSSLRIHLRTPGQGGGMIAAALVTTGGMRHAPYVLVRGTGGHLVYHYTLDLLHVFAGGAVLPRTYEFSRVGLLADLCAHVQGGAPLAVPLAATGAFTRVLETIVDGPDAMPLGAHLYETVDRDGERFRIVRGIAGIAERVAWEGRLFHELGSFAGVQR